MKKLLLIFSIAFLASFTIGRGQDVKSHKITFEIKNAGITVEGSFSDLRADISFDPKRPDKSVLIASVGVATIDTGIKMRDKDLQMSKYFHVDKYPRIRMTSKKIKNVEKNRFNATFDLTIKGITKEVDIPFTYTETQSGGVFAAEFKVNRRHFGVGSKSIILSDEVTVFIEIVTTGGGDKNGITSRQKF